MQLVHQDHTPKNEQTPSSTVLATSEEEHQNVYFQPKKDLPAVVSKVTEPSLSYLQIEQNLRITIPDETELPRQNYKAQIDQRLPHEASNVAKLSILDESSRIKGLQSTVCQLKKLLAKSEAENKRLSKRENVIPEVGKKTKKKFEFQLRASKHQLITSEDELETTRQQLASVRHHLAQQVSEFVSAAIVQEKAEVGAFCLSGLSLLTEELNRVKAQKVELAIMVSTLEEDTMALKALAHIGVAVRLRFLEHAKHFAFNKYEKKYFDYSTVQKGNHAAHGANISADALLFTSDAIKISKHNNLEDLFTRLYDCSPFDEEAINEYPSILSRALTSWIAVNSRINHCDENQERLAELISEGKNIIGELRDSWTQLCTIHAKKKALDIFEVAKEHQVKEKRLDVIAAEVIAWQKRKRSSSGPDQQDLSST